MFLCGQLIRAESIEWINYDQTSRSDPAKRKEKTGRKKEKPMGNKNDRTEQSVAVIRHDIEKPLDSKKLTTKPKQKSATSQKQEQEALTPYQGQQRCLGFFHCEKCNLGWRSGKSWANKGQQCRGCQQIIYPHKQLKERTYERRTSILDMVPFPL